MWVLVRGLWGLGFWGSGCWGWDSGFKGALVLQDGFGVWLRVCRLSGFWSVLLGFGMFLALELRGRIPGV